jgi:hypothetical protein
MVPLLSNAKYVKNGFSWVNSDIYHQKMPNPNEEYAMVNNLRNIVSDLPQQILTSVGLTYEVEQRDYTRWIVYVRIPNGNRSAKLEFLVDDDEDHPGDPDIAGSVLRRGSIPRSMIELIMDSILERL